MPLSRASCAMRRAAAASIASGFSTMTCTRRGAQASTTARWSSVGPKAATASGLAFSTSVATSGNRRSAGMPYCSA